MPLATTSLLSARQDPGAAFIILAIDAVLEKLKATPATAANVATFDSVLARICVPPTRYPCSCYIGGTTAQSVWSLRGAT
jgi:hypothetical protein